MHAARVSASPSGLGPCEGAPVADQADERSTEELIAPEFGSVDATVLPHAASLTPTLTSLAAERDQLAERLARSEARGEIRITDLQHQLSAAFGRCDSFAAKVPALEARLNTALAAPHSDRTKLADLRKQLGLREAEAARSEAECSESKRVQRDAMGRLVREQESALAERVAHTERIDSAERARAELDRRCVDAERRARIAEGSLAAAAVTACSSAEPAQSPARGLENHPTGPAIQLQDAADAQCVSHGELDQMRASSMMSQEQLAAAVKAAGQSRAAAEQLARQNSVTAERERKRSIGAVREADERRISAEQRLAAVERARTGLVKERDGLTSALGAAAATLRRVEERLLVVEGERDAFRQEASAANARARTSGLTATAPAASPSQALQPALGSAP